MMILDHGFAKIICMINPLIKLTLGCLIKIIKKLFIFVKTKKLNEIFLFSQILLKLSLKTLS
jgi:hypothetical protein